MISPVIERSLNESYTTVGDEVGCHPLRQRMTRFYSGQEIPTCMYGCVIIPRPVILSAECSRGLGAHTHRVPLHPDQPGNVL